MGANIKKYRVIDNITGKKIFEGNSRQICEITGISQSRICEAARDGRPVARGRYLIIDISEDVGKVNVSSEFLSAARKWDEFCEPIRKKYGIPVYKPEKGVRR